jgi:hypothetical protein
MSNLTFYTICGKMCNFAPTMRQTDIAKANQRNKIGLGFGYVVVVVCLMLLPIARPVTAGGLTEVLAPGDTLAGAIVTERDFIVTRQGMFDYMNGGAELYFDHGWNLLIAADLKGINSTQTRTHDSTANMEGETQREFKAEVYRLDTHQNVLKLLETQRDLGDTAQVGDKSYYGSGMLVWVQGTYYIRLWSWQDYDTVRQDVTAIATKLAVALSDQ